MTTPDGQLDLFSPRPLRRRVAGAAAAPTPGPPAPAAVPPSDPPPTPEERLAERLRRRLGAPSLSLVLTDNRSTLLSSKPLGPRGRDGLAVRLHRTFAGAPGVVLDAVAVLTTGVAGEPRRRATAVVREHVAAALAREAREAPGEAAPEPRPRRMPLRPRGEHFDLVEIRDEIRRRYFGGRHAVAITWGRWGRPRRRARRRTVRLGSWTADQEVVRVHPVLDRPDVPRRVVEWVVYHELLHAELGEERRNGRRRLHTPEFRRREREFDGFDEVERWLDENLHRLLAARGRRGRLGR